METFETVLYYFSLGLFVAANAMFWGIMAYGVLTHIREWFVAKQQE
jgi:hypothetical protein